MVSQILNTIILIFAFLMIVVALYLMVNVRDSINTLRLRRRLLKEQAEEDELFFKELLKDPKNKFWRDEMMK